MGRLHRASEEIYRRDTPCEGRGKLLGVPAFDQIMDDEQRARTRDDRPPDLGGMSLAEVACLEILHFLGPEERASSVGGKVLFAAQRPRAGGDIERHSHLSALVLPHSG